MRDGYRTYSAENYQELRQVILFFHQRMLGYPRPLPSHSRNMAETTPKDTVREASRGSPDVAWLLAEARPINQMQGEVQEPSTPVVQASKKSIDRIRPRDLLEFAQKNISQWCESRARLENAAFVPKRGIFSEAKVMVIAGSMVMFFLMPYITNQNHITSTNSADISSYISALKDFWSSMLHRIIPY